MESEIGDENLENQVWRRKLEMQVGELRSWRVRLEKKVGDEN